MAFSLGEYQDIFLEEADDQLQELNSNLLEMEQNPEDEDIINNIFRAAHSLKSSAAFVGLNDLSDLAHKMENLLQGVRDKTMVITPEIIDLLFKCFDHINVVIEKVSQGEAPDVDLTALIEEIKALAAGGAASSPKKVEENVSTPVNKEDDSDQQTEIDIPKTTFNASERKHLKRGVEEEELLCYEVVIFLDKDAPMKWVKAQLILNNIKNMSEVIKTIPAEENLTDDEIDEVVKIILLTNESKELIAKACDVDLVRKIDIAEITLDKQDGKYVLTFHAKETIAETDDEAEDVVPDKEESSQETDSSEETAVADQKKNIPEKTAAVKSGPVSTGRKAPTLRTVKVSVEKLDELLNNVGELVIANSGFFRLYEDLKKLNTEKSLTNEFKNRMEQMSRIAKDLQSGIMKTRMVPIGQVFGRFNRLVRDLAKDSGKNVQLVTKGEDTELDKKVIDVIGEPLMHMVRNSIDHGIEAPAQREEMKKPETATVTLSAHQGGNQIYVEVIDDGKGLNAEVIRKKAIDRGLVTPEIASNMEDEDIFDFIFHPGFSTAEKITDVSGRGVGMNVVKEVVLEMNGSIQIESEPGMGTRFIMAFPLTLAIIPAIMVNVESETYAIPLSDVIETIKISAEDVTTIEGHEVINLRGEILSLLRLNKFVGIDSQIDDENKIPVVVVGYSNRKIGLIVDQLEGKLEIVIKSLEQNYRSVEGLAGASILGDGSICLILDIASMITKVISEQEKLSREDRRSILKSRAAAVEEIAQGDVDLTKGSDSVENKTYIDLDGDGSVEEIPDVSRPKEKNITLDKIKNSESVKPASLKALENTKTRKTSFSSKTESDKSSASVKTDSPKKESVAESVSAEKLEPKIEEKAVENEKIESGDDQTVADVEVTDSEKKSEEEAVKVENQPKDIFDKETTPVASAGDDVDDQVKEVLENFRSDLHKSVSDTLNEGNTDAHMKKDMNITDDDLRKLQVLANVGIMNGADSLSKLIGNRVDLAIPDVKLMPVENIPGRIGNVDEVYLGVYMPLTGDVKGTILFGLSEASGYTLIDELFKLEIGHTKDFNDDAKSAIKEITNIVGSSVINAISDKTGLAIKPDVPSIVHDYMQSVMDSILVVHNVENDYALVMDTEFYYQDDRIMGNLLVLPESKSVEDIVKNLKG